MGLDAVELILRVEEEFRIEISDAEIMDVATAGQLHALIAGKLETPGTARPIAPFYRLRRAMMTCLGLPRNSVRPSTQLAVLLPEAKRIRLWKELKKASGLNLPNLRHPKRWRNAIRTVALLAAIGFHFLMSRLFHPHGLLWIPVEFGALVVFVIVRQLVYAATPRKGLLLPARTVGELAKALPELNPEQFKREDAETKTFSKTEVWGRLSNLVCNLVNVEPDEVTPETRCFEDVKVN